MRLEDIAKEVGLLPITGATHLLFIANARFSNDAVEYARKVSKRAAVGIYLLDRDDFNALRESPMSIARLLRVRAEEMLDSGRPEMYGR